MANVSVNRNNILAVRLLQMRRHLMSCDKCKSAIKAKFFEMLCDSTRDDILFVAMKWDSNIAGRIAAARSKDGLMFLCPDPNAHGAAYAATAEPVTINSVQDTLF